MSRARGNELQNALAAYLRRWWVNAESAGSGRNGRDVLGTPGVWWENKTSGTRLRPGEFVRQATGSAPLGELPVVVWWPPGVGAKSPGKAIAMLPLPYLMGLLEICGLAPPSSLSPPALPTTAQSPSQSPSLPPPSPSPPTPTPSPSPASPSPPTQMSPLRLIKGDLS